MIFILPPYEPLVMCSVNHRNYLKGISYRYMIPPTNVAKDYTAALSVFLNDVM